MHFSVEKTADTAHKAFEALDAHMHAEKLAEQARERWHACNGKATQGAARHLERFHYWRSVANYWVRGLRQWLAVMSNREFAARKLPKDLHPDREDGTTDNS